MRQELLYLLGHPIAHSKSPVMHNALYRELGLPWEYRLKDCATEEEAHEFIKQRDFVGINITTPYKSLAFSAANLKAASAKLAKGANVLARKEDHLVAYNMDGDGCVSFLERKGFNFEDSLVVVCGTGPTALAIVHSVALAGASKVVLIGRNKERSQKAMGAYVEELGALAYAIISLPPLHEGHRNFREAYEGTTFSFGSYRSTKQIFGSADLVINATPVGMKTGDCLPIEVDAFHEGQTVFDVVYGHGKTKLIEAARAKGCQTYDGAGMLVAQAVAGARVFFEIAGESFDVSDDDMFDIMARAAAFEC